jgi:hypothetical protein
MTSIIKVDQIQNAAGVGGLIIDSAGRILQPAKPVFRVRKTATQSSSGGADINPVSFGSTPAINIGNMWNTSTNKATAPVTGLYVFSFNLNVNRFSASYVSITPRVNGSTVSGMSFIDFEASSWVPISGSFPLELTAGDEFHLVLGNDNNASIDNSGYVAGYLLS